MTMLQNTAMLKNHLHISVITTTTLKLRHMFLMNHLQFNGLIIMNQQLNNSTHMFPSLNHINKLMNHPHISHTTIMNLQLKPISLMNQKPLIGNHTTMLQLLPSTTMMNQLNNIFKN